MFDIDTLTMSMNLQPVFTGNQTNGNVGTKANINTGQVRKKTVPGPQYVLLSLLTTDSQVKECDNNDQENDLRDQEEALRKQCEQEFKRLFDQGEAANTNSTNRLNIVSTPVNVDANGNRMFTPISVVGSTYVNLGGSIHIHVATHPNADLPTDPLMPDLEDTVDLRDTKIFSGAYDDKVEGTVADFNNLELLTVDSPIPTTKIHKDHPKEQII
nr:hypothetical protein [Tanacetum cinerariifolium]